MTYPGDYHPAFNRRMHRVRSNHDFTVPPWEIVRQRNSVIVRCWIPGTKREDIELIIRNHRLYLSAHSSLSQTDGDAYACIRYAQEIPLPWDADTTWFAAEYHRGLLTIQLPTEGPSFVNGEITVVVY